MYNLEKVNWINEVPYSDKNYTAQIRYHGEFLDCRIEFFVSKKLAQITFTKPVLIASGQSCVIYDEDIVLGGGIVC
ncbi:MAG: aminomethyltransferase beta-barrel domain-containing protein [Patescibacteria group bacterium]